MATEARGGIICLLPFSGARVREGGGGWIYCRPGKARVGPG